MKVLIITIGFFPGKRYGGHPVSVNNFCALMKDEFDCRIVVTDHEFGQTERYPDITDGWNDRGHCQVRYLREQEYGYQAFEEIINEFRPDVIYLQSLFQRCVVPALRLAKKHGIRVMLATRGELCKGAFHKRYKKLPYIAVLRGLGLFDGVHFQSTCEEETHAIHRRLGIPYERIHPLTNIPSIPSKTYDRPDKKAGQARLVYLSRIHPIKNLMLAISYLKDVRGDVVFDIYGPTEDEAYWEQCRSLIATLPAHIRVTYKGVVSHEEVHEVFSAYDAFLLPTTTENYGHVIAESLLAGCPVIISDRTPWTDINGSGAGWAIPLECPEQFVQAIQEVVDAGKSARPAVEAYVQQRFDLDGLRTSYLQAFTSDL